MNDAGKTFVGARGTLDDVMDDLSRDSAARPGKVASPGGTTPETKRVYRHPDNPNKPYTWNPECGQPINPDVDSLFGATQGYIQYKTEKFEHRLVLWYRLQGYNGRETAKLTGYTAQSISWICKQAWFQDAFCKLAAEMGKDAVTTFLEGQVMPAFERTVDLAENGKSEAIRLAANKEILDRYLGKSTVKVETKGVVDVNHTVLDANRLLEEQRRLDEQIKANGLVQHGRS